MMTKICTCLGCALGLLVSLAFTFISWDEICNKH